jgi:hypothetical protein
VESLRQERRALLDRWIKELSLYQVGDTIDITDYAHRGKKMRVDAIAIRERYAQKGEDLIWSSFSKARCSSWIKRPDSTGPRAS